MPGEIIETEFGLARPPTEDDKPKALCHPLAPMYADGLCRTCFDVREQAVDKTIAELERPGRDGKMAKRNVLRELHRNAEYVKGLAAAAQAIVEHHMPDYAELHFKAAQIAAEDGDAGPAQWALSRMVGGRAPVAAEQPDKPSGQGGGKPSVQVMIGVNMGQVPKEALDKGVIVVETKEPDDRE